MVVRRTRTPAVRGCATPSSTIARQALARRAWRRASCYGRGRARSRSDGWLCLQPPMRALSRTLRRPWSASSRLATASPSRSRAPDEVERELTVAGLRSGVIDDHSQLGWSLAQWRALPYLEVNATARRCEIVRYRGFGPVGAGADGVLASSGTARADRSATQLRWPAPVGAENCVVSGQAAFRYSLMSPPQRAVLTTWRCAVWLVWCGRWRRVVAGRVNGGAGACCHDRCSRRQAC